MSLNRNKYNSGRRKTARSAENINVVRKVLENNPNLTRICIEKYGRHSEQKFAEVVPHRCSSNQLFCKICNKFTAEHPRGSVISIKLVYDFTEITLPHGCSPVYLLHICKNIFFEEYLGETASEFVML